MRLLTKIWLSTSLAITALFMATGWIVSQHVVTQTSRQLTDEVAASLRAYRSLWQERASTLETLSEQIAGAPQVRAAFGTNDVNTIADAGRDLLQGLEKHLGERGLVVVAEPRGRVLARLSTAAAPAVPDELTFVDRARPRFPAQQSGFGVIERRLYQFVITPVYVQSGAELALIKVLVTGFEVTDAVAAQLQLSTGSDFLFASGGQVFASTLGQQANPLLPLVGRQAAGQAGRLSASGREYIELSEPLLDLEGRPLGTLSALRSLEAANASYAALRRQIALIWIVSLALSFLVTYALARQITRPLEALDNAAAEVARENFECRIQPVSNDEIGRLARSFNQMCASIRQARDELIGNERLYTIARLAGSIVHDMRNPLAAIYGGSEMLLESDLPPHQQKRLLTNLFKASRKIQAMLEDLLQITRGRTDQEREECLLGEILQAAAEPVRAAAEAQKVEICLQAPEETLVAADRGRLERAFSNLLVNALEAMPAGGLIHVDAVAEAASVTVRVEDTGPGIHPQIRDTLFQPFVSAGKKDGTGLGLALARQTVIDHGGQMWVQSEPGQGAAFFVRLPLALAAKVSAEKVGRQAGEDSQSLPESSTIR